MALREAKQAPSISDGWAALKPIFAARAAEYDKVGDIPTESLNDAARAGLFALTVPRAFGGEGATLAEAAAVARGLAAADPAATLILCMNWIQHANIVREGRWPEEIYRRVARDAVAGQGLINALRVEPALGSPHRGGMPETIARRTEDGWRVSGHKIYSTGARVLGWFSVYARTDEDSPRVGYFLIPATARGIRIEATWDQLGMRATRSDDVILEDVVIPLAHAVDVRTPEEWRSATSMPLIWSSLMVSAVYLGIADAARDWLAGFLHSRVPSNLGRPLARLERMQFAVGEIEVLLRTAGWLLDATATRADQNPASLDANEPALVKHVATENAILAVQKAVALIGNPALGRANPLERHLRDVLCGRIHSPQGDSILQAIGSAALNYGQAAEH